MSYTLTVKDSKKKERQIIVLAACKKSGGTVHVSMVNDQGEQYFAEYNIVHGYASCTCKGNAKFGMICYHIDALVQIVPLVGAEGIVETVATESIDDVMAEAQAAMTQHIESVAVGAERASIKKLSDYLIGDFYEVRSAKRAAFRCKCADPRECRPGWCKWSGPTYDEIA